MYSGTRQRNYDAMKTILTLLLPLLFVAGCDKNELAGLKGSFTGTFTDHGNISAGIPEKSGPVQVTFDGNTYRSTGNPDRIPAGGSGTYKLLDGTRILFEDKNIWTANFDWGLILNGEYEYRFKGDSLLITRYSQDSKRYEYKLKQDQ
jgi:hypothetical protein